MGHFAVSSENKVYVNDRFCFKMAASGGRSGAERAGEAARTLQRLFDERTPGAGRDLDFITPSHDGSRPVVICAGVYKDHGRTYFYRDDGSCGNSSFLIPRRRDAYDPCSRYVDERLYAPELTTIASVAPEDDDARPWATALAWANAIRAPLAAGGEDDVLWNPIRQLAVPPAGPGGDSWTQAGHWYYGDPGQGTYPCAPNAICNVPTMNGEIFHPQDAVIASSYYEAYENRWVRVGFLDDPSRWLVARLTDLSPKAIELSAGVKRALGYTGQTLMATVI